MIDKNSIPLVSLESMNKTHFEEVDIINILVQQIDKRVDNNEISQTLEKLLFHIDEHFSGEERLMKNAHYPSLNMHKADHGKVLNQARYAQMQWRNHQDINMLEEYIKEELITWLDQHIKAMDTPLSNFLSDHL